MARGSITRGRRRRAPVPVVALLGVTYILCPEALAAGEQATAGAQVAAAAKQKHDPAEAQRAVANAGKLLEAGKHEQAIATLSATLAGGNLAPATMAKALLYRGIAYRQQKKPAQAISDFTSALWLKGGLSEADRADGLRQRAGAYQEAGLSQGGEVQPAATKDTRAKERAGSPPAAAPGTMARQPRPRPCRRPPSTRSKARRRLVAAAGVCLATSLAASATPLRGLAARRPRQRPPMRPPS